MGRRIIGLDVGTYSIKAVEIEASMRGMEWRAFYERLLPLERDPNDTEIVAAVIGELFDLAKLPKDRIVAALPGTKVSTRRVTLPTSDRKRVAATVPFEIEAEIPFSLEDIIIDTQEIERGENSTDLLAVVAKRESIAEMLDLLAEAKIEPQIIEADATALFNLSAALDPPANFYAIIDFGHSKTLLCLVRGRQLVGIRTIPLAGAAVTAALAKAEGLTDGEAEAAKIRDGLLQGAGRRADEPVRKLIDRWIGEVDRTLYHMLPSGSERASHVYLCGGGADLPGLADLLGEKLGLSVERMPVPKIGGRAPAGIGERPGLAAQALGLAIRGTAGSPSTINFRRGDYAVRSELRDIVQALAPTGVLAAALVVIALGYFIFQIQIKKAQEQTLSSKIIAIHEQAVGGPMLSDPLPALEEKLRKTREEARVIGVSSASLPPLEAWKLISERISSNVSFDLSFLDIGEDTIKLRGLTDDFGTADRIKAELLKEPRFAEIAVGDIRTVPGGRKQFPVTIRLPEMPEDGSP